ncbi:MAG: Type 1 glutamine amidotransferase-like domain-containing protein [Chitinophagales bacterium]|nr:Type 1 glutamine amidotransferase-like domain-containing protein [Chitinophagales bacterium]
MRFILFLLLLMYCADSSGQGFTNWIVGDTTDFITTNYQNGIVLAGGGGDNDDAMQWMLERAAGGDVVIIRASNSDGYNPYFYQELGVEVNSVETIRFDDISAASDDYVIRRIREAEVLFIAGGDQYDYYQYWKDNEIEDAINYLINEKRITVGGTSAGMAILGNAYYTPSAGSLTTSQALSNPFHPNVDILGNDDFINTPYLSSVVTDTHYDQRERAGRHVVFLARLVHDYGQRSFGIACNEYTAVCIDGNGLGYVYGEYPEFEDYAYFLQSNCQDDFSPETIQDEAPLTWNRGNAAVKVYRLPGNIAGSNYFDLNNWETGEGGDWQNWFVIDGELSQIETLNGDCSETLTSTFEIDNENVLTVSPNPFQQNIRIKISHPQSSHQTIRIFNLMGQVLLEKQFSGKEINLRLEQLPAGHYVASVGNERVYIQKNP